MPLGTVLSHPCPASLLWAPLGCGPGALARTGLWAITIAVLLPGPSLAAQIHVPGDQPTIAAGLTAAGTGDSVVVAPGTWTGHFVVAQGKTVMSSGGQVMTTMTGGAGGSHGVIQGFTITGRGVHCFAPAGQGMVIRDCVFDQITEAGSEVALNFDGGDQNLVTGCTFTNNQVTGAPDHMVPWGGAIRIYTTTIACSIVDCAFSGNTAPLGGGAIAVIDASGGPTDLARTIHEPAACKRDLPVIRGVDRRAASSTGRETRLRRSPSTSLRLPDISRFRLAVHE